MRTTSELGLVHVYTGNGKGKTTAALGLAMRARGQGLRVCVLQFLKGGKGCGEHKFVEQFPAFEIEQISSESAFGRTWEALRASAQESVALAAELSVSGKYDVLILDEILTALQAGMVDCAQVLALIRGKLPNLELILTGRGAPPEIVEAADLVTEMVPVKHPFDRGIQARRGIEF